MSITMEELEKVEQRVINGELEDALNKHLNKNIKSFWFSHEEVSNIAKSSLKLTKEVSPLIIPW